MDKLDRIISRVPSASSLTVDWPALQSTDLGLFFADMERTPQDPVFHGEGSVWNHTRLTCEALAAMKDFQRLPERRKAAVFLAALLHDAGKTRTTRMEGGRWTAPHHAGAGAKMTREFLWRTCGLCGTPEKQAFRETVCSLIQYHMVPWHALEQKDGVRFLRKIASEGLAAGDFSIELLCLLSEADVQGRIAPDKAELAERVQLCAAMAEEAGCLTGAGIYDSPFTRRSYLSGRNVLPDQPLYDDAWGEVILLCGLPGTGKDTWVREHCPELPMISLDELRKELGVSHEGPQTAVIRAAEERAKALLRERRSFVWNATSLTRDLRQRRVSLFESYHARVRIIYLETDWETERVRNQKRPDVVPEPVLDSMLFSLEPPMPWEAQTVEWLCQ